MKRHAVLAGLSRDHHKALIIAQSMKIGAPVFRGLPVLLEAKRQYMMEFVKEELRGHFQEEESVLFPFVKESAPEMNTLIDELIADHRAMEIILHHVETESDVASYLDEMGRLLETHIRKEERILFQQIQDKLTALQFHELEERLKKN